MRYTITETQNGNKVALSYEYAGTLISAKRTATQNRAWQGTTLRVVAPNGRVFAERDTRTGAWFDPHN